MRRMLLLIVCLAALVGVDSPTALAGLRGIGVLVGPVASNQSGEYESTRIESGDAVWGLVAGGFAEWGLPTSAWSLLSEAHLVTKGFVNQHRPTSPQIVHSGPNATFLSLPLLLSYGFSSGHTRPYMVGGLGPEILLSGANALDDDAPRVAVALHVGGGVALHNLLDIRIRYFRDITDSPTSRLVARRAPRNYGVALTCGLSVAR